MYLLPLECARGVDLERDECDSRGNEDASKPYAGWIC